MKRWTGLLKTDHRNSNGAFRHLQTFKLNRVNEKASGFVSWTLLRMFIHIDLWVLNASCWDDSTIKASFETWPALASSSLTTTTSKQNGGHWENGVHGGFSCPTWQVSSSTLTSSSSSSSVPPPLLFLFKSSSFCSQFLGDRLDISIQTSIRQLFFSFFFDFSCYIPIFDGLLKAFCSRFRFAARNYWIPFKINGINRINWMNKFLDVEWFKWPSIWIWRLNKWKDVERQRNVPHFPLRNLSKLGKKISNHRRNLIFQVVECENSSKSSKSFLIFDCKSSKIHHNPSICRNLGSKINSDRLDSDIKKDISPIFAFNLVENQLENPLNRPISNSGNIKQ